MDFTRELFSSIMDEIFSKEYLHTISNLYPGLDEEQVKKAAENLVRYTELIVQIHERIIANPEAYAQFKALTGN